MRALPAAAALLLSILAGPLLPAGAATFPPPDEVAAALATLDADPRIHVVTLGLSEERREIRMAIVADPPVVKASDVGTRAVTVHYTQQHGNEPAGTPAVLRVLANLTGDLGDEVLANQVVLVIPQLNLDGAQTGTRENAAQTDTNRDHLNLTSAAARLLHGVVHEWRPVVMIDHHEYSGVGTGLGPVRLYDYDATILWPVHANVDNDVVASSKAVNDAMRAALTSEGYTSGDYGKLTLNGIPVQDLAGGPQPSIARNHYGLHHAVSLLVESRVDDDNGQRLSGDGAARRIRVHELTMEATLRYVTGNAQGLQGMRDAAAGREAARGLRIDYGADVEMPAWGYRVAEPEVLELLALHGLPVANGTVEAANGLRAHAGLLLEPASPWNVTTTAVRLEQGPAGAPGPAPASGIPGPGLGAVAALALLALAARRR